MLFRKSTFISVIVLVLISVPLISYSSSDSFKTPTRDEREKLVKSIVFHFDKMICPNFVKNIVELTDQYSVGQITELVVAIINGTEEKALSKSNCLENLREIVSTIGTVQMQQQKLDQLKEIVSKTRHELEWLTDEDFVSLPPSKRLLLAEERSKIIKEILCEYQKPASESIINLIVKNTEYYNESDLRGLVVKIAKASNLDSSDEDRYFERPMFEERFEAIKEILSLVGITAPENLIEDIAELTEQYSLDMVRKVVQKMIKKSKINSLDPNNCIEILKEAIDLFDEEEEIQKLKLEQLEELALKYGLTKC